jgi:hypothetical protein
MPGFILFAMFLVVGLAAISALGSNSSGRSTGEIVMPTVSVIRNEEHKFRLHLPAGGGWRLLDQAELTRRGNIGFAGAENSDGRFGIVLVEDVKQAIKIAGREGDVARAIWALMKFKEKSDPVVEPLTVDGLPAVRYRFTATAGDGNRLRIESTAFERQEHLYQLTILGLESNTRADGSSFRPFTDAFQLEPLDKERPK